MTTRIAKLGKQFVNMAQKIKTDITLYTTNTPNGIKPSILLEELNLEYKVHAIKMTENEQKEEWFLKINPNGRIPALTDTLDGKQIRVFESGAMLQYLVDRYDKDHKFSFPQGSAEHWEMTSWLMWQMGGLGPMQGQANHFKRYAPEKIEYGINRYTNETRRLYRTLDTHLSKQASGYIVGDKVTIADISIWGWVASAKWAGVDLSEFPHLEKWLYKLLERPGFEAGRHVPTPHSAFDLNKLSEEELEEKATGAKNWVQAGMKDDAKK
ncbi:glutathione S-transferase [Fusarium venenatum]|nr:glutathione S-transferase [Fusarium venenatum]